ncbi:Uma2 family endonuclease [Actinacidiphila sp. bgisy167]|uniref:Uma2 family endonuclease n=1 Tax=Actinacidiphila sp. bgisy167 TaxID=3413797 RepID=UPI003D75F375
MDAKTYARMRALAMELLERGDAWAVEIGEGVVTMTMSPVNRHELISLRLRRQIERQLSDDPDWAGHVAHSGPEIKVPAIGRMRRPDVVVVAEQALDTPGFLDPSDVALVAEVVSASNPDNVYREKTRDYPAMDIPLYLIIDPRDKTLAVLSDPAPGDDGPRYRARHDYAFGDAVPVGPWIVESGEFPSYDGS